MPDYIELFYYADQASFQAHNPDNDEVFEAAEKDRADTWLNGELDVPLVFQGAIEQEAKR